MVQLARSLKVTRGRKLRVDTAAVETDIHFPTDSALIGDGVRVVSRLLRRAMAALGEAASGLGKASQGRVQAARKLSQRLHRLARRKGDEGRAALKAAYGRLIATAKRAAAQGRRVLAAVKERADEPESRRLADRFAEVLPRLKQGIRQAERRVLKGDPVPAGEKVLSLFEPHTQIVPRFKAGKAVEFGRKIRLDEADDPGPVGRLGGRLGHHAVSRWARGAMAQSSGRGDRVGRWGLQDGHLPGRLARPGRSTPGHRPEPP